MLTAGKNILISTKNSVIAAATQDAVSFIETNMFLEHPQHGPIKFKLHDFQKDMIDMVEENQKSVIAVARQMGTSYVMSAYLLQYALRNSSQTIAICHCNIAAVYHQIDLLLRLNNLLPVALAGAVTRSTRDTIEFANGCKIIARVGSANAFRGYGISLLYLSDFSNLSLYDQILLWNSLAPVMVTGTKTIITSTPTCSNDTFADIFYDAISAKNGFEYASYPWFCHPDRTHAWANQTQLYMSQLTFRREYECEFIGKR